MASPEIGNMNVTFRHYGEDYVSCGLDKSLMLHNAFVNGSAATECHHYQFHRMPKFMLPVH